MHLELTTLKLFKSLPSTENIHPNLDSVIDHMDNSDSLQSNQSFIQIESTTRGVHDTDDESYPLHYNESFYLDDFREHVALEKFFLYCLVFTGTLTNSLTLIQMLIKKRQKSGSHVLLFHLLLSDFMMIAFDILPEIYWYENFVWPAGDFACKIFHVLRKFALYSNSFVIVCISFNRYYLLKEPHIFQKEKQRAYRMLKLAYSASALLSTPELYLFSVQPHPDFGYLQCVGFDKLPELWQLKAYNAYHLLGMYLLPLHMIIYLYTRIISSLTLKKHVARMTNSASSEERLSQKTNYMLKTKKKAITTFLAVTITFVVCWTPYSCLVIIHISGDEGIISETLDAVMRMFYLLSSTLNPIVHNSNIFEKLFFCKSSGKPCPLPTVRLRSLGRNHEASGSDLKPINCSNNTIRFKP